MQQKIADHVDHDAVKQLQILEYMTAQLRRTHKTGAEALMGHGIEVAFDFGGQPTWYHGEICGVTVDKIRVRYYYDNTCH
jgi:hypothetical protein